MNNPVEAIKQRCIANEKRFDNEDMSNVLHALERAEGDLRCLVAWVDSVIAGYEPFMQDGSDLDVICKRWR